MKTLALLLLAALALLAACAGPAADGTPTPETSLATATATSAAPETAETATSEPEATATQAAPQPTETGTAQAANTPSPANTVPTTTSGNVFETILGEAAAPPGWSVRPCQGDGPLLCVNSGEDAAGINELSVWHLETLPDFQRMLQEANVPAGPLDLENPEHRSAVLEALRAFVENYHRIFEEDREITYRDRLKVTYARLDTVVANVGALPGLKYGFAIIKDDGTVLERWILYSAFDGALLHTINAFYFPDTVFTFRSDEDLRTFEPYLDKIIAGLMLPLPVVETDVKQVRTLVTTPVFRYYATGSNPVVELPAGETLRVTGKSPNGQWWRVTCPQGTAGECWVKADANVSQPGTP
jgi:hypothetical protein